MKLPDSIWIIDNRGADDLSGVLNVMPCAVNVANSVEYIRADLVFYETNRRGEQRRGKTPIDAIGRRKFSSGVDRRDDGERRKSK